MRRVEGRGHKRRGEEMLPKIFSGFSEGGCWLIIDGFGFWIWRRVGGIVFDVRIGEYGIRGLC